MNPFFDWLIKSSVSIVLLYSVFKLVVSRDKTFIVSRFVLVGVLVVSAVLPLIDLPGFQESVVMPKFEIISNLVAPAMPTNMPPLTETPVRAEEHNSALINPWLVFYLVVVLTLSFRLLVSVFRVYQLIRRAEKQPFQKVILAIVKDFIQPFSFLQHIVLSEKDFNENKEIVIAHEYAHIKNLHVIDLVICELFTALHWFNPLMWLLRRDLKLIHEYQADQAVLNKGIDEKKYQLLVLEKAVGERRFAMANHFKQKPILKRIKMMKKKNKRQWTGIKLLLFVPILLLLLQAFTFNGSRPKKNKINGTYRFVSEEIISNGLSNLVTYDTNTSGLKTWSDEYVLWVNSSPRGTTTGGSLGGGTYNLKGNKYVESFEHHASTSFRGVSMKMYLEMKRDTIIQIWPVDNNFNYDKNNCTIHKYVRVD